MKHITFSKVVFFLFFIYSPILLIAQESKRAMTFDELVSWKRITTRLISENGKWIVCKMEPWKGDAVAKVYNSKGKEIISFTSIDKIQLTTTSNYLLITQKSPLDTVEYLKLKKTKEDQMPMDRLIIYQLPDNQIKTIDSIKAV